MSQQPAHESTVRQGVDTAALADFLDFAVDNPDAVQFGLEAVGEYEGRAIHTTARTGPYTLGGDRIDRPAREYVSHFGGHLEVEDAVGFEYPTDRQEVIETALACLTGCLNAAISMSAIARGIDLDTLETRVRVDWDPFVFLHLRDIEVDGAVVDMFSDIDVDITVSGDLSEADRAYLEDSVGRSAVYNLFTLAHTADATVTIAD